MLRCVFTKLCTSISIMKIVLFADYCYVSINFVIPSHLKANWPFELIGIGLIICNSRLSRFKSRTAGLNNSVIDRILECEEESGSDHRLCDLGSDT
jgi:hypothetical protein